MLKKYSKHLFLLAVVCILLSTISISSSKELYANKSEKFSSTVSYIVEPGDTLWKISQKFNPDQLIDRRKHIYQIRKFNKLDSAVIYPGQEILVPRE